MEKAKYLWRKPNIAGQAKIYESQIFEAKLWHVLTENKKLFPRKQEVTVDVM